MEVHGPLKQTLLSYFCQTTMPEIIIHVGIQPVHLILMYPIHMDPLTRVKPGFDPGSTRVVCAIIQLK